MLLESLEHYIEFMDEDDNGPVTGNVGDLLTGWNSQLQDRCRQRAAGQKITRMVIRVSL